MEKQSKREITNPKIISSNLLAKELIKIDWGWDMEIHMIIRITKVQVMHPSKQISSIMVQKMKNTKD